MLSNLYPDAWQPAIGVRTTKELTQITELDTSLDYMGSYYMGYIDYNRMPSNLLLNKVDIDASINGLTIINEAPRHHAWGYVLGTDNGYDVASGFTTYYVDDNGDLKRGLVDGESSNEARFINKIEMSKYATANSLTVSLTYIIVPAADLDENDTAYNPSDNNGIYTVNRLTVNIPVITTEIGGVTVNGYDRFLKNYDPIDFGDITVHNETVEMKFYGTDFDEPGNPTCRRELTIGGVNYVMFAQLTNFDYQDHGRYYQNIPLNVVPFIEYNNMTTYYPENSKWMRVNINAPFSSLFIGLDYYYGNKVETTYARYGSSFGTADCLFGNFHIENNSMYGDPDTNAYNAYWYGGQGNSGHFPGYTRNGIMRGRHIVYSLSNSSNNFEIYSYMTAQDIWNAITLFHKIYIPSMTTPVSNSQYTTDYSVGMFDMNIPTEERKSDTTENILPYLMNWQYPNADITEDKFSSYDIPSYELQEGDLGDNIYINTNIPVGVSGFLSNYALSRKQVNKIGDEVWTNIANPIGSTIIDNFFSIGSALKASEQYELNAANIIDYFVSLKYFPFNVYSATTGTLTTDIYIGTGTSAITLDENCRKVNNTIVFLDGGTVKLPEGYSQIYGMPGDRYGTFLDHEPNTSVSVYVPFCGTASLPASVVMGTSLTLTYCVDLLTGGCMAIISKVGNKQFPIATLNGTVGFEILLTGNNAQTVTANAQNATTNMQFGLANRAIDFVKSGIGCAISGNSGGGNDNGMSNSEVFGAAQQLIGSVLDQAKYATEIPDLCATMPLTAGSTSTLAAIATPLKAYVQIRRHYVQYDGFENIGYLTDYYTKINGLGSVGWVQMLNPRLESLTCTREEAEMIRKLLTTGIYV